MKPHTIKKELGSLRLALKLAKRAGLWSGDLDAVMPDDFSPQYKPRTRALEPTELAKLLGELRPDQAARVAFIVATSARLGETERARWEDIREDRTFVRLRGTKTELSDRFVPIAGQAAMTLLSHAVTNAQGEGGMLFQPFSAGSTDSTKLGGFGGQLPHSADSQVADFTGSEVPRAGIEPATRGFSVPCSTD